MVSFFTLNRTKGSMWVNGLGRCGEMDYSDSKTTQKRSLDFVQGDSFIKCIVFYAFLDYRLSYVLTQSEARVNLQDFYVLFGPLEK